MPRVNQQFANDQLIAAVLSGIEIEPTRNGASEKQLQADLRALVRHDYVASVRRYVDYRGVREILAVFRRIFPSFNTRTVRMLRPRSFAAIAASLKFHIKSAPLQGEHGLALRGFYVTRYRGLLKRPLVYVNTAHHPLAAMTTFLHELGHHKGCEILNVKAQPVHFFDTIYRKHLDEPAELAADMVVSFAGYPAPIARKIFATPWNWGLVAKARDLSESSVTGVRGHLNRAYGLDLMDDMPSILRLHYLCGMIHYAKLRWALLAEYDL